MEWEQWAEWEECRCQVQVVPVELEQEQAVLVEQEEQVLVELEEQVLAELEEPAVLVLALAWVVQVVWEEWVACPQVLA